MKRERGISGTMALLEAQMQDWGRTLKARQIDLLYRYAKTLSTYTKANVVGSRGVESVLLDHVLDSLSCLSLQDVKLKGGIIDVGTGGGLPGIPLAIVCPELEVTLLEATKKKVLFLEYVRVELGLPNLKIINSRAEAAGMQKGIREEQQGAVARALASLPVVLEYCTPFVKKDGPILAMKGHLQDDELLAGQRAAAKLGAELSRVTRIHFRPELEQKQRHITVFRKIGITPDGYPRRVGLAKKRPLGS